MKPIFTKPRNCNCASSTFQNKKTFQRLGSGPNSLKIPPGQKVGLLLTSHLFCFDFSFTKDYHS